MIGRYNWRLSDPSTMGRGSRGPALTIEEAAVRLQTTGLPHPRTAHRCPDFPQPVRIGKSRITRTNRYRLEELEAWLKKKGEKFVPYVIEKGVPIPSRAHKKTQEMREALNKMGPSDSMYISRDDELLFTSIRQNYFEKGTFATRKEGAGRRIWRLK